MSPGREFDIFIAENLMGQTKEDGSPNCPAYSTCSNASLLVAEKLRELGYSLSLNIDADHRKWRLPPDFWPLKTKPEKYQCIVYKKFKSIDEWFVVCDPYAMTLAHAICLAARETLEFKEER